MPQSYAWGCKSGVPWSVSGGQPAGAIEVGPGEPEGGAPGRLLVIFLEEAMQA